MRRTALLATAVLTPLLAFTACAPVASPAASTSPAPTVSSSAAASGPSAPTGSNDTVEGTVLRFRSDRQCVDVTIGEDNPTVRALLSRLPLKLTAKEFAGREKIVDIPGGLTTEGSPGSDPEDGDLIYYAPWGNLGFYYDSAGVGYSDDTIHLGTYDATRLQLDRLGGDVTVSVLE